MAKWVTVARLDGSVEADLVRMRLEQAGLAAVIRDQNVIRMNPVLSGVLGGIRVDVPEDQEAAAIDVLADLALARPESRDHEALPRRCPACGGEEFTLASRNPLGRAFAALLTFLAGAGGVPRAVAGSARCKNCGEPVPPISDGQDPPRS
jgi:hypothetical protein